MMRSLWTSATGMTSQQLNVDTISNNIANVNTMGYKKETMEFQSLLYQTMRRADLDPANNVNRPVNLQIGHGVKPVATGRSFSQGSVQDTGNTLDFAIEGPGFFTVQRGEDDVAYTRDGSFKLSVSEDEGGMMLVTSSGLQVLDMEGEPITFDEEVLIPSLSVDRDGYMTYINDEGEIENLDFRIGIVQFSNPQGLSAVGGNLYEQTAASGEPVSEGDGDVAETSSIHHKFLEMSNVSVATEMVDLIVAQRAYELNSKCIQTSDDMLQTANNLKR